MTARRLLTAPFRFLAASFVTLGIIVGLTAAGAVAAILIMFLFSATLGVGLGLLVFIGVLCALGFRWLWNEFGGF